MAQNQDHHNQGGLTAFLGAMAFVFAFFFFIVFVNKDITLDEKVSSPAPKDAPKFILASVKEPWLPNEQVAAYGHKLFAQNCAVCHGEKGDLVGGISTARHLVDGKWAKGDGLINHFKVLQVGIAGSVMVSWKANLKPDERWAVLNFIETLTNNKSKDKPEELAAFAASAD